MGKAGEGKKSRQKEGERARTLAEGGVEGLCSVRRSDEARSHTGGGGGGGGGVGVALNGIGSGSGVL